MSCANFRPKQRERFLEAESGFILASEKMAEAKIVAPKRKDRVGSENYDGIFEVVG